ncbi:MAG: coenzyme F420-0:L-glutamate ligase [Burkholderiales bacterium]
MSASASTLTLRALEGIGEVRPGHLIEDVLIDALERNAVALARNDVVAVCQKIVSKSENRYVELASVEPSTKAVELSAKCGKDPRYVEVVLRESTAVVRCAKDVLIVRHRLGFVVANAAIDQSNIEGGDERVLLLPENPDRSAAHLRDAIRKRLGVEVAVVITDSFGRAWRLGVCGVCIGCAGLMPLADQRGQPDRFGRALRITQVAVADQIASAATLIMGEGSEGLPVVIVSGVPSKAFGEPAPASALIRCAREDLFGP